MYLENLELNKNEPDYQIEDFWYCLKISMKKFYQNNKIKVKDIQSWSDNLNAYKKDKKYDLIEQSIKNYIANYAVDIMKYDMVKNNTYSNILLKNIKRWREISNKFHFGDSDKNRIIYILFEGFAHIKNKLNDKLFPILELFRDIETLILNDYKEIIFLSFKFGQFKILNCITQIIGRHKVFECIKTDFDELKLTNKNINTTYMKLYKKYNKICNS
jgi:hypothetical protein